MVPSRKHVFVSSTRSAIDQDPELTTRQAISAAFFDVIGAGRHCPNILRPTHRLGSIAGEAEPDIRRRKVSRAGVRGIPSLELHRYHE